MHWKNCFIVQVYLRKACWQFISRSLSPSVSVQNVLSDQVFLYDPSCKIDIFLQGPLFHAVCHYMLSISLTALSLSLGFAVAGFRATATQWRCVWMTTWTSCVHITLWARCRLRRLSATCCTWWSVRTTRRADHSPTSRCAGSAASRLLCTHQKSSLRSSSGSHPSPWARSSAQARATTISVSHK